MYRGNSEYFALKRQLIAETKLKAACLPIEKISWFNPAQPTPLGLTFVYEWRDDGTDILGYGCNSFGNACVIRPKIVPGLFVISGNVPVLREVCALRGYDIQVYDIEYEANNFSVWELLQDYKCEPGKLVKIITNTVKNAEQVYYKFKNDTLAYKYGGVSQYFNIVHQIMFEMIIRNNADRHVKKIPTDYSVPQTTMRWFDENLTAYTKYDDPKIPVITFDIETVSSDPHRVPTGDDKDDKLFTVSIHHTHTNVLYTLIYLPLKMSPRDMIALIKADGYNVVPNKSVDATNCTNILECFNCERDLLVRTMKLLTLKPKLHILYGYNSIGYDIKFLLMRCAFFKVELGNFIWQEGYNFGVEQMHLDLFRIIVMRYRYKSYKLNDVALEILKDSKTGVSAVNLRYTFFYMVKYNKYHAHIAGSEKMPSIKDTLEYNNADTLLVSKLEGRTKCIPFIIRKAMDCQVPLSSMNTNYNKMQFKLWSECFVVGLSLRMFMGTFKPPTAAIKCPMASPYSATDIFDVTFDLTEKLNPESTSAQPTAGSQSYTRYAAKKATFPGGANFCLGEINADNVQMYDYVTAYPILMDRKNISDETTTVLAASVLALIYSKIQNVETFKTYDYLAHNGSNKSETVILYYQYIYDKTYCGGEFPFTMDELVRRQDSPVIVIWEGRRGILSRIVARFSEVRAETKLKRKALDEAYDMLIDKKNDLAAKKILMDEFAAMASNHNNIEDSCDPDDAFGMECDDDDDDEQGADDGFGFDDDDEPNIVNQNDDFGLESDDDVIVDKTLASFAPEAPAANQSILFENQPTIVSKFLLTYGRVCSINDLELSLASDPMNIISELADIIALERNNVSNSYDLQKSTIASIYGCVGKMIMVVAAVITSMTRSTLLSSAQYCRSLGCNILYIDTDSIMITGCTTDLSSELNRRYPFMEMEMKVARKCMFVKRKTYYKIEDGSLKYGQNVNGPRVWRECVEYFYNRNTITTNPDIYQAFYDFFMLTYKKLQSFKSVTPEFLACITQNIKTKDEYKTMTTAKKFKLYLADKYPAMAGGSKHSIFYYLDNSVLIPCLRPEVDIKSIDDLKFVNLFKYFQNMYTTIFNLIKFHIRKNNEPYNITLSSKYILLLMLKGFLDAYMSTFSTEASDRIITQNSDADQLFDDPLSTEMLDEEMVVV